MNRRKFLCHVQTPGDRSMISTSSGLAYWYHDGATIKSVAFGNRSLHTSRLADGNSYRTREDAQLKRHTSCTIEVTPRCQSA